MTKSLKVIKSLSVTDAVLTASSVPEADYAQWSGAVTNAAGDRVIVLSTHMIYESLQSGNTGKNPLTEPLWWIAVRPTNRWQLFDLSTTTQTIVDEADFYELTPGVAVNSMALVNISGILTVRTRLTDPSFGVVFDKLVDLTPITAESNWYSWFFDVRTEQTKYIVSDLPTYPNATLRVDVTSSGQAFIGALVFGNQRSLGMGLNAGVRLSIQDYSRKERNAFGDVVLVQRAYSSRITMSMLVKNSELDNTYDLLADLRATPCLWIGSQGYEVLSLFGFYNNFEIGITYPEYSDCTLDLESLT